MTEKINNLRKTQIGVATFFVLIYPLTGFLETFLGVNFSEAWKNHMVTLMYVGAFTFLPEQILKVYKIWLSIKNGDNLPENHENIGFKIQKDEQ